MEWVDTMALISIAAFILSQAADVWTTARALNSGQGKEANPIMAWLIGKCGLYPGLIMPKAVVIGVIAAATVLYPAVMTWVVFAIAAGYAVIVYRNYGIVKI